MVNVRLAMVVRWRWTSVGIWLSKPVVYLNDSIFNRVQPRQGRVVPAQGCLYQAPVCGSDLRHTCIRHTEYGYKIRETKFNI